MGKDSRYVEHAVDDVPAETHAVPLFLVCRAPVMRTYECAKMRLTELHAGRQTIRDNLSTL